MAKLLLVEDEPVSCRVLAKILSRQGYLVATAATVEALNTAVDFNPDAVITDWLLKDTRTGLEIAESVRKRNPRAGVVFISGLPAESLQGKVGHLANCRLLEKPFHHDELLSTLQMLHEQQ
jgi:DNA-binding response OmpR family regulator